LIWPLAAADLVKMQPFQRALGFIKTCALKVRQALNWPDSQESPNSIVIKAKTVRAKTIKPTTTIVLRLLRAINWKAIQKSGRVDSK
jgi:hypothetical protein